MEREQACNGSEQSAEPEHNGQASLDEGQGRPFFSLTSSSLRSVSEGEEAEARATEQIEPRLAVSPAIPAQATTENGSSSLQEVSNGSKAFDSDRRTSSTPEPPSSSALPLPPPLSRHETGAPPKKKARGSGAAKYGNVELTLEGKHLWDEFYRRGTEMIVNRAGRRMFPGFAVSITGLKPKLKYTMRLEVVLADNHRFKFLNGRWLAVGTAEPQHLFESYTHPDAPNSGAFWMRHGVSFRKLKITNNKEKPAGNALLHSMHKYYLRVIVEEEKRTPPGEERLPPRCVLSSDFPETSFIAVTAYQNEEVTQLKITNNPFAKAFRENAAEMDWDTAQMIYGGQAINSPSSHLADQYGFPPGQFIPPSSWALSSPLLPPTPLTASLPPISPMPGATPGSYFSPAPFRSDSAHQCFTWPQASLQRTHTSLAASYEAHRPPVTLDGPSYPHHNPPAICSNLPEFESVFTST